jgi:hypothetical protein
MNRTGKNHFTVAIIAVITMGVAGGSALAGGFLDLAFEDADFDINPLIINNPYWPLRPDLSGTPRVFTYIGETEDECVIDQISVDDILYGYSATYLLTGAWPYGGKTAVQVVDTEWVFEDVEDCDPLILLPDDSAIKEFTLDWYMQDDQQNIWYVGELSQNYEEFDCGEFPDVRNPNTHPQCFEGSWEAGMPGGEGDEEVIGEAGIVVPGDEPIEDEPLKTGTYYMQEVAFEAEDMAKILRQHASSSVEDGVEPGEYEDCRKAKEWTAQEPGGSVEHKWYCADGPGLVLIEGVGGGPTEVEVLVDIVPVLP